MDGRCPDDDGDVVLSCEAFQQAVPAIFSENAETATLACGALHNYVGAIVMPCPVGVRCSLKKKVTMFYGLAPRWVYATVSKE